MPTYSVPSGKTIVGGRTLHPNALLDAIAAAPDGSWIKGNTNRYEDVWTSYALRAPYGADKAKLTSIISAWSGFAWDHRHHRLILFGGGHANTSANDVYVWSAETRAWVLAYYPTDYIDHSDIYGTRGDFSAKGGSAYTPNSAHCYDNQHYLERLDRFMTFCGADYNTGYPPAVRDALGNVVRTAGAYTLDLSLHGKGFMGGPTGSNVHSGAWAGVDILGANAWKLRDWYLDHPQKSVLVQSGRTNGVGVTVVENDRDVVYQALNSNGQRHLYRFEIVDHDYHNDLISKVGRYWNSAPTGIGSGAYDSFNKKFLITRSGTTGRFFGWDLMTPGATNSEYFVTSAEITLGPDIAEFNSNDISSYGMDFDPVRREYVLWSRGGTVWRVNPPDTTSAAYFGSGWSVEKVGSDLSSPRPMTSTELSNDVAGDAGVIGKWKYAKDLDAFVGLQHTKNGDVWIWKPIGWIDPRI